MQLVRIYTDGACTKNPGGRGGWAFIIEGLGERIERCGSHPSTTNNRMELTAAIEGLKALPTAPLIVTVVSDSQYVVKGASVWSKNWIRKGRLGENTLLANVDLWRELLALAERHRVTWEWVRGHNGHPQNERCDQLAEGQAAKR